MLGGGLGARDAGEGAPRGDDELDGVADDDGVVQQKAVLGILQHAALDELAVAVAIACVGVLHSHGQLL